MVEIGAKDGKETSEFRLTLLVNVAAIVLAAGGAALETMAQLGIGQHWVGTALVIVAFIAKIVRNGAYEDSRVAIKTAAITATAAQSIAEVKAVTTIPDALDKLAKFLPEKNHE